MFEKKFTLHSLKNQLLLTQILLKRKGENTQAGAREGKTNKLKKMSYLVKNEEIK